MPSRPKPSHSADSDPDKNTIRDDVERPPGRGVLDGAFRILRALPETPRRGQVSRLATTTGLPRPTVYRLLGQLREIGAVVRVDGAYRLAPSIAELGLQAQTVGQLRQTATGTLWAVREKTGATVSLIVPHASGGVALDVVRGIAPLPVDVHRGQQMPEDSAAVEVLRGPRRVALDDRRLLRDLTCYAVAVDLGADRHAALAVMTPARDHASRYEHIARLAATRIADAVRLSDSETWAMDASFTRSSAD